MKMPQEKNCENTDLKCDLVLCRNKDYEKGGHHKIGSLLNEGMAQDGEDQLDRAHIKRGGVKTGRRRKIIVNDNKNQTTDGT